MLFHKSHFISLIYMHNYDHCIYKLGFQFKSINHTIYSVTIKISHGHGVPWKNAILFKEMIKWIIYTLYEWQSTLFQKRKCLVSGDLLTQIGIILFKWSFIRFLETIVIVYWYVLEKNLTCKNWENIKMQIKNREHMCNEIHKPEKNPIYMSIS